ncbi:hypothetical protein COLO4_19809 [Corchorus olitorius]|uniref:Expansin-like EG45 domain-containing protein n=1 Tax=Corchorus olitorius TaxID=93759 RepID=A0A1R3J399_9ROSI|nr:hypothetical protein COLO4_19809 [Corchorus olitorius]
MSDAQDDGTATYYTPPNTPSACYRYEDEGTMIAAPSDKIWNNGAACGEIYQVTCVSGTNQGTPYPCWGSGTVQVKIVDYCPPASCRGTIDLSQEAFASIADPDSGFAGVENWDFKLKLGFRFLVFGFARIWVFGFQSKNTFGEIDLGALRSSGFRVSY